MDGYPSLFKNARSRNGDDVLSKRYGEPRTIIASHPPGIGIKKRGRTERMSFRLILVSAVYRDRTLSYDNFSKFVDEMTFERARRQIRPSAFESPKRCP